MTKQELIARLERASEEAYPRAVAIRDLARAELEAVKRDPNSRRGRGSEVGRLLLVEAQAARDRAEAIGKLFDMEADERRAAADLERAVGRMVLGGSTPIEPDGRSL